MTTIRPTSIQPRLFRVLLRVAATACAAILTLSGAAFRACIAAESCNVKAVADGNPDYSDISQYNPKASMKREVR